MYGQMYRQRICFKDSLRNPKKTWKLMHFVKTWNLARRATWEWRMEESALHHLLLRSCAQICSKVFLKWSQDDLDLRKSSETGTLWKQVFRFTSLQNIRDFQVWHHNFEAYIYNFFVEMYRQRICFKASLRNPKEIENSLISLKPEI